MATEQPMDGSFDNAPHYRTMAQEATAEHQQRQAFDITGAPGVEVNSTPNVGLQYEVPPEEAPFAGKDLVAADIAAFDGPPPIARKATLPGSTTSNETSDTQQSASDSGSIVSGGGPAGLVVLYGVDQETTTHTIRNYGGNASIGSDGVLSANADPTLAFATSMSDQSNLSFAGSSVTRTPGGRSTTSPVHVGAPIYPPGMHQSYVPAIHAHREVSQSDATGMSLSFAMELQAPDPTGDPPI